MNAIPPRPRSGGAHSTCFVQTRSGACIDLLAPDFSAVTLTDIATSLSRLPRFVGGTRGEHAYSVAQHSVFVAAVLLEWTGLRDLALAGLLHDVPEMVTGDIPSPVKRLLPAIAGLEERLLRAVYLRFGVPLNLLGHSTVWHADLVALATEKRDLLNRSAWPWLMRLPQPQAAPLEEPWPASLAHARFIATAITLGLRP